MKRRQFLLHSTGAALLGALPVGVAAAMRGTLLDGPLDSPFGRIASVADPTGATFQVIATSEAVPTTDPSP